MFLVPNIKISSSALTQAPFGFPSMILSEIILAQYQKQSEFQMELNNFFPLAQIVRKKPMQNYLNGKCPYFQVSHSQYSQSNELSEVLEMKSIYSSSSANSSPEIHLDVIEKGRIEEEAKKSQDVSTKIYDDGKRDEEKMETLLLQIKYSGENERPMPTQKKQQVDVDVNLLEKSEVMSEQLECVESIRVQIAKPSTDFAQLIEDLRSLEESKPRVIYEKPEKVKDKRSCYMACQRANAHSVSASKKEKEIKPKENKIEENIPKKYPFSPQQEEKIIEENGKSNSKRQKKEFIMACQRANVKAEQPKKKKEKEVANKKKKERNQEKLVYDPNAFQTNLEFQEYFERCKFQPCGKLCRGGNPITMVCVEKNCDFQAQHCTNPQCLLCSSSHQNCFLKFTYEMFTKSMQRNVMRQKKTMQIVYSTYDNIVKEINKNREKTMKFLCVQGVNEALLKDLEARYQEKQHISFKGKEVLSTIEMLGVQLENNQSREKKIFEKMKQDEKMILEKLQHEMHLLFEPYTICSINVLDSRLITNKGQAKYVLEQLAYPKDMKLLYRASEYEFSIQKFHQICDKQDNTFTIIKTEFGKLIGGFTPLKWGDKHGRDRSNRTFMLAISLKEKLEHIKHGESAIYYSDTLGPSFGGLFETKDIEIFEENGILSCNTSFPSTYNWKKFFTSSQQSWRFLTGVQKGKTCRVMDYEVFKVFFREE